MWNSEHYGLKSFIAGLLLSLIISPQSIHAQWITDDAPPPPTSIEDILQKYNFDNEPGAAVAVIQNGEVVHTEVFGKSSLEHNLDLNASSRFQLASISKQFTAYAILQLADKGRLDLDAAVRQYLPELTGMADNITVRNLLHHTSGLKDDLGMLSLAGWRHEDLFTNEDVINVYRKQTEVDFTPGERYQYSNANYSLLASIISRVTDQPFADWVTENIFIPVGMQYSSVVDSPGLIVPHQASHYEEMEDGFKRKMHTWYQVGPGGIATTIEDMVDWVSYLMNREKNALTMLSRMSERGKTTDGSMIDYAYGLVHGQMHGLPSIGHGGSSPGTQSNMVIFPEQDFAVVVLSNRSGERFSAGQLSSEIASFYLADAISAQASNVPPQGNMIMITTEDLASTPEGSYAANPDEYHHYAGSYVLADAERFEDNLLLRRPLLIADDGGRLTIAFGEPPGIPLIPIAENRFKVLRLGFEISFERGSDGEAYALVFHITEDAIGDGPTEDLYARKQQTEQLTPDALTEYAGHFYSEEIETLYRFSTTQVGKLQIFHPRHGLIPLDYLAPDEFLADTHIFTNVSFKRDPDGEISGVRLRGYSWGSSILLRKVIL